MPKGKQLYLIISLIAILLISAAMTILWGKSSPRFWISYAFFIIAILIVSGCAAFFSGKHRHVVSRLTLLTISIIYLIAQGLCSLLFAGLLKIGVLSFLAVHILVFGLFLILWLLSHLAIRHIEKQD